MKDQYFGNVNDYRKYGLLRALLSSGDLSLLVAWMLTPDDGSTDGGQRRYLQEASWARHDPTLHHGLTAILREAPAPAVELIERTDLLPNATFHRDLVPDGSEERRVWRESLYAAASGRDLVFLDPDNGLEVKSRPLGRRDSCKHVLWSEVEHLSRLGCSLLIYQHFPREPRARYTARRVAELVEHTGLEVVWTFATSRVLFLLVVQPHHAERLYYAAGRAMPAWQGQFSHAGCSPSPNASTVGQS